MKVRCSNLDNPFQHPTRLGFKVKVDCYLSRCSKFPNEIAVSHCPAEMLYWGILEGDPEVRSFVPQSHRFYLGTERYTSDIYYKKRGRRIIAELKNEKDFIDFEEKSSLIREFLKSTLYEFKHITNESIRERETFARNWLTISRTLITSTDINTVTATEEVLDRLSAASSVAVGDIIDMQSRVENCQLEIALFRLANIGKVHLSLDHSILSADTEVRLCD